MRVERFDCTDGTHHFSVVDDATDELCTCVIHDTAKEAEAELAQLAPGVGGLDVETFPQDTPTDLYTAEALRIHEQCDAHGVPREANGERLSIAQRVEALSTAYRTTLNALLRK